MALARDAYLAIKKNVLFLRTQKAWSQEDLAFQAGVKADTVQEIESGKRKPQWRTIRKIAKAFGMEAEEFVALRLPSILASDDIDGRSFVLPRARSCAAISPVQKSPEISYKDENQTLVIAEHIIRTDLMMDRRTALKAAASAVLTGASLLDPLETWLWAFERKVNAEPEPFAPEKHHEIEKLEHAAKTFRDWDHSFGGGLYRKAIAALLKETAAILEDDLPKSTRERLYRLMANLAETAATMAWDSGLQRQAQGYYDLALRAAYAGRDLAFGANVFAGMARQMISLGHPQDALELIRLAQSQLDSTATPRLMALLHTREAWALAASGRVTAFRRATKQAQEHFGNSAHGQEPHWVSYFDEAELAGVTGGRFLELARLTSRNLAEYASLEIENALLFRGPEAGRSFALDQIGLAESRFLLGDIKAGARQAHKALDALERTTSERAHIQLKELHQQTMEYSGIRLVRDLQGRIHDSLSKSRIL